MTRGLPIGRRLAMSALSPSRAVRRRRRLTSDATLAREPIAPSRRRSRSPPRRWSSEASLPRHRTFGRDTVSTCILDTRGTDRRHARGSAIGRANRSNSGFDFKSSGRTGGTLEDVGRPDPDPAEMGSTGAGDRESSGGRAYVAAFTASSGRDRAAVANAIATFDALAGPAESPVRPLPHGEASALSETERQGYVLFKAYCC